MTESPRSAVMRNTGTRSMNPVGCSLRGTSIPSTTGIMTSSRTAM